VRDIKAIRMVLATAAMAIFAACGLSPVKQAETFEQKSFALYGTYVIFQGKAAELVQDSAVSERVKQGLRDADKMAYPVAESLVDAATTVSDIRDIIEMCKALEAPEANPACTPSNEQRLANAINNLSTIYFRAQPIILNLVATVKGTK
jgi:hypothetical protein